MVNSDVLAMTIAMATTAWLTLMSKLWQLPMEGASATLDLLNLLILVVSVQKFVISIK